MIEHNTLVRPCKTREGYEVRLINELGQTLFKLNFNDNETAKEYYESNKTKADWSKEVSDYAKANDTQTPVTWAEN
jgi:hypothetical protein